MAASRKSDDGEHLSRVRRICLALPESSERLSHGEPTFVVRKKELSVHIVEAWHMVAPKTLRKSLDPELYLAPRPFLLTTKQD